ncbi:MAG: hypothetical protein ACK55Z_18220, partial [bacterium]
RIHRRGGVSGSRAQRGFGARRGRLRARLGFWKILWRRDGKTRRRCRGGRAGFPWRCRRRDAGISR